MVYYDEERCCWVGIATELGDEHVVLAESAEEAELDLRIVRAEIEARNTSTRRR
jgi:hypothetical protein